MGVSLYLLKTVNSTSLLRLGGLTGAMYGLCALTHGGLYASTNMDVELTVAERKHPSFTSPYVSSPFGTVKYTIYLSGASCLKSSLQWPYCLLD